MRRTLLTVLAVALAVVGLTAASSEAGAPATASVTVIQAVPGATVDVAVDGRRIAEGAQVGDVLGPFDLEAGTHDVTFSGDGMQVDSSLEVSAGATSDVVLHLPADVGGDPVVHSYAAPDGPIGPDKARVLLAHTATVAPADVQVDGKTVFTNIANGEFADADVPAGSIEVALLPSGTPPAQEPILGPLDVSLEAGTLSMIYAYGNPRDGSMNVIAHTATLAADGSVRPTTIDTGSAGLVGDPVTTFEGGTGAAGAPILLAALLLGGLVAAGAAGGRGVRRRRHHPSRRSSG